MSTNQPEVESDLMPSPYDGEVEGTDIEAVQQEDFSGETEQPEDAIFVDSLDEEA